MMMHAKKWLLLVINLVGGIAVLGSYVWGFQTYPNAGDVLWGGVPESIRSAYTANMFVAAAGYLAFTYFILFRLSPTATRVFTRFGYGAFNSLYAAILIPSALWMPLTFLALEQSGLGLVWMVRFVLALVGLASLGMFAALLRVEPRQPRWAHSLAVAGSIGFCLQTVLLDAVIWGALFQG